MLDPLLEVSYVGLCWPYYETYCFGPLMLRQSRIKQSHVMFITKFGPQHPILVMINGPIILLPTFLGDTLYINHPQLLNIQLSEGSPNLCAVINLMQCILQLSLISFKTMVLTFFTFTCYKDDFSLLLSSCRFLL